MWLESGFLGESRSKTPFFSRFKTRFKSLIWRTALHLHGLRIRLFKSGKGQITFRNVFRNVILVHVNTPIVQFLPVFLLSFAPCISTGTWFSCVSLFADAMMVQVVFPNSMTAHSFHYDHVELGEVKVSIMNLFIRCILFADFLHVHPTIF